MPTSLPIDPAECERAAAWLAAVRRLREDWLAAAAADADPVDAAVAMGVAVLTSARAHPQDATLIGRPGAGRFADGTLTDALAAEVATVNDPAYAAVAALALRLHGSSARPANDHVRVAVIDIPHGVVQSRSPTALGAHLDAQLAAAVRAAITTPLLPR